MVMSVLNPCLQCWSRLPLKCEGRLPGGQTVPCHERIASDARPWHGSGVAVAAGELARTGTSTGIGTAIKIDASEAGTGPTGIFPNFSPDPDTECIGLRLIIQVMD